MVVFATGVINDPVEFAIFAYVDTWAGLGGVGMMTFLLLAHMSHATDLTFLALAHMWHTTQVMGRVGWVGWGWWRFFHLHTCDMLRKSWGGLGGWGGDDDVSITCTHMWHATQVMGRVGWVGWGWRREGQWLLWPSWLYSTRWRQQSLEIRV